MQPPVQAQLESPVQASAEGTDLRRTAAEYSNTTRFCSKYVVVHSCPPTPAHGLVDDPRGVRDEEAAGSNSVTPTSDVTLWRHP